ncbi:hypothetical protein NEOKW01_0209 [Nematocida sp. AWRm80]|nr:hypothetical protein NEOKW01_0209 [Nematocida sp. AWRm80]
MVTPNADKNEMFKRTNSSRLFTLDEFFGMDSEALQPQDSLSFTEDLHKVLEERSPYSFECLEKNPSPKINLLETREAPTHIEAWTKKKRRTVPHPWSSFVSQDKVISQGMSSPSYMNSSCPSITGPKTQKLCLGILKKPYITHEKSTLNSILPLYLNATTSFEGPLQKMEFLKISHNFIEKVDGIDYDALTVQQLKGIMKEFGLNYTGKKQELITRIQQTYQKIIQKQQKEGLDISAQEKPYQQSPSQEEYPQESKSSLGYIFF